MVTTNNKKTKTSSLFTCRFNICTIVLVSRKPGKLQKMVTQQRQTCQFVCSRIQRSERHFASYICRKYKVSVSFPTFSSLKERKEFYGGLLEPVRHPWRDELSVLSRQAFMEVASSLFLKRKHLPGTSPDLDAYASKLSKESPLPDSAFSGFIRETVDELFPFGWDQHYGDRVESCCLPRSACLERSRMEGGAQGELQDIGETQSSMYERMHGRNVGKRENLVRLANVFDGSKYRIVSVNPVKDAILRPLHETIYNHISRFDWLLRGEAKPSALKHFTLSKGEMFISGDYESATDNLNIHIQKQILYCLLERSQFIPWDVKKYAMDVFDNKVIYRKGSVMKEFDQKSGQMMGSLLSFPLLCLVNYITFKFAVPRKVPVKINGDDIVFRATHQEYQIWEKTVKAGGLVLSKGKTFVSRRFFSINSCFLKSGSKRPKILSFLRFKSLIGLPRTFQLVCGEEQMAQNNNFRSVVNAPSLASRYKSFINTTKKQDRHYWACFFLRENMSLVKTIHGSLTRCLGIPVPTGVLKSLGLWARERFYLSFPTEKSLTQFYDSPFTKDFSDKYPVEIFEEQKEIIKEMVASTWLPQKNHDIEEISYYLAFNRGIPDYEQYRKTFVTTRMSRLMKVPISKLNGMLCSGVDVRFTNISTKKKDIWVRRSCGTEQSVEKKYASTFYSGAGVLAKVEIQDRINLYARLLQT